MTMLDIETVRVDSKARKAGGWVSPLPDTPKFRIFTKGMGGPYRDAVQAAERRVRREKRIAGNKPIPAELQEKINVECLIDVCLGNVEGLVAGKRVISFEEYCEMIRGEDFPSLRAAAFTAAILVGEPVAQDVEDAVGNSGKPLTGISAGEPAPATSSID